MTGQQTHAAQVSRHIEAGQRFLQDNRPDDAAAEFLMAIRASGVTPNGDALTGLARAYHLGTAANDKTFAAYEAARPYFGSHWDVWKVYVVMHLATAASFTYEADAGDRLRYSGRLKRDIEKASADHQRRGKAESDQGMLRFRQLVGAGDFPGAYRAATAVVSLADWCDETAEEYVWAEAGIRRTDYPHRSIAPPLYRAVVESGLETLVPDDADGDSDIKRHIREEIVGRARRQLVFRGQDGLASDTPLRGGDAGVPLWAWVFGGVAYLILFAVAQWIAALLAVLLLVAAGYTIYRHRALGRRVPLQVWIAVALTWIMALATNLWLGMLLAIVLLGGVALLIYQRSHASAVSPQ